MTSGVLQTHQYKQFRAAMKELWRAQGRTCASCGQEIDWDGPRHEPESFELDHIIARKIRPDLALDPTNAQPMHVRCNRSKGKRPMKPSMGETTEEW